ncbi:MAG: hypothetical protein IJ708_03035 [Clostridia bacterium]|nr:hypothetical protein [Clostridia bacterium]
MHSNSGKAFLFAVILLLALVLCVGALADPVFAVDKKEIQHGEPLKITYDLSAFTFDHAELLPFARWNAGATNGATYRLPVIPLSTVPKGTYTFTDTNIGESIYLGIQLYDANGWYLDYLFFSGDDGEVYLTDSWNAPASVPSFQSVTPSATRVSAGTPISANFIISGGNAAYTEIHTYWSVYDDEGFQLSSNWESWGTSSTGTATLYAPSKGGTHYLSALVRCADGWEYTLEDTNHGIEVQGDTTSDPLTLQLTFKDVNDNILDWTQDEAIPGQPIFMSWVLHGGYAAYHGYLNLRPISGDTSFGYMSRSGAIGTLNFWVNENASPVILEVECDDNHGNTISQQITIPVAPPLQMTAAFQQSNAKPGDTVTVNWNITGGLAPYDVQVDWTFDEGCMRKTDQSTVFSLSQGSDSYTVPLSATSLEAHLTVRDQSGATRDEYLYVNIQ